MDTGDTIRIQADGYRFNVVLDDRVYPDRTCGQVEAGWWAYREDSDPEIACDPHFFVNVDKEVYGPAVEDSESITRHCGFVVGPADDDKRI